MRKLLVYFESKPMSGRDVEALSVVQFFREDCFYSFVGILRIRLQSMAPGGHFEEAVDDDEEFCEIGRKSSANDIFLTFATDFLTEAPALEHLFRNSALPNCEAPVLRSL